MKQNGSVLYQLLVPAQEQNEGISIANVRLMYGSVDRVIHLPSACIAARLGTKSVYGFSQNAVYACSFGETTFRAYALPINVTAVLGMMNDQPRGGGLRFGNLRDRAARHKGEKA